MLIWNMELEYGLRLRMVAGSDVITNCSSTFYYFFWIENKNEYFTKRDWAWFGASYFGFDFECF